jgi:hypothetical protein
MKKVRAWALYFAKSLLKNMAEKFGLRARQAAEALSRLRYQFI